MCHSITEESERTFVRVFPGPALNSGGEGTVALVDDLVNPGCLVHLAADCRVISVGKRGGCASTPQAFIEKLMVSEALRGERVVHLKGGDPLVFGRAGEEIAALRAAGVHVEVVPGITAGVAAAAAVGVSLTHRQHAPGVALITGHRQPGNSALRWDALAQSGLTLVIYMGVAEAPSIESGLLQGGLPADTPVLLVQATSSAQERHVATQLGTLCSTLTAEQLGSPCVMLIGKAMQDALKTIAPGLTLPPQAPYCTTPPIPRQHPTTYAA